MGHLLDQTEINALLAAFGYWAVFAVVGMESAGLPLPGETLLIGAAIYARFNPQLGVGTVVLAAAAD